MTAYPGCAGLARSPFVLTEHISSVASYVFRLHPHLPRKSLGVHWREQFTGHECLDVNIIETTHDHNNAFSCCYYVFIFKKYYEVF